MVASKLADDFLTKVSEGQVSLLLPPRRSGTWLKQDCLLHHLKPHLPTESAPCAATLTCCQHKNHQTANLPLWSQNSHGASGGGGGGAGGKRSFNGRGGGAGGGGRGNRLGHRSSALEGTGGGGGGSVCCGGRRFLLSHFRTLIFLFTFTLIRLLAMAHMPHWQI